MIDYSILIIIITACICGGIIGLERESVNRPAGFRTHILVCVGSAVVMYVNIKLVKDFSTTVNLDPARLGAQVLSGIGFIGAGTIIKEGVTVRGLTTAASIWITACIGLAVGSGYYIIALMTTTIVMLTLLLFAKLERAFSKKRREFRVYMITDNTPGLLGQVGSITGRFNSTIRNISLKETEDETIKLRLRIKTPANVRIQNIIDELSQVDGIHSIDVDE